jgi:D-alanine--poly(phosphoribitol) ligase subunit 2
VSASPRPEPSEPRAGAERIGELVRDTLGVQAPSPTTDLIEAGLIDSLALVSLITELEAEYAIRFPLERFDVEDFRTLERMAAIVNATREGPR